MSFIARLIIGSWIATLIMIGFFALYESGALLRACKQVVDRLESSRTPVLRAGEEKL